MAREYLELQNEVLDHGFAASRYRPRVKRWLNDALGKVARRVDLPTEDATFDIATVALQAIYALPPDLVRLHSLRRLDSQRDRFLFPEDRDILDGASRNTGEPSRYALDGANLLLWPVPDRAYALKLRYARLPVKLVNDTDPSPLSDEHDDLLIVFSLWKAYRSEDDAEMARDYERQWRDGLLEIGGDLYGRDPGHVRQVGGMLDVWGDGPAFDPDVTFP